jgi:hypothetical protein
VTAREPVEPSRVASGASATSGAIVLALACAALSGASCGVSIVDFGAHVDGPGIGLEWSKPLGSEYGLRLALVLGSVVVHALLSLVFYSRAGAKPIGILALPGLWFVGIVVGVVGGGRALPAWWKLGCDHGNAYACLAASGVTDGAESKALEERACAEDVGIACARIARRDPTRLPGLCAEREAACRLAPAERAVYGRCNVLAEFCTTGPPSPAEAESR